MQRIFSSDRNSCIFAVLAAVTIAFLVIFPAPLPGYGVSANDTFTNAAPFTTEATAGATPKNGLRTDAAEVFHPDIAWSIKELKSGSIPLWNPTVFTGWPQVASQQTSLLAPQSLPFYFLSPAKAAAIRLLLLVAIAAAGMFWFARTIGASRQGAALAAIAYGLSGPMMVWSMHPHDNVHSMLPWVMFAVELVIRGRRFGGPLLAATVGICALAGHPQSLLIDGILAISWLLGSLALKRNKHSLISVLTTSSIATVLGLIVGAVAFLPLLEMLGQASTTERGGKSGPPLSTLANLIWPELWGRDGWTYGSGAHPDANMRNFVERTAYVGILPSLLAGFAIVSKATRNKQVLLLATATLIGVVLAYRVPVISPLVTENGPLRAVSIARANIIVSFALAALAAFGLAPLSRFANSNVKATTWLASSVGLGVLGAIFAGLAGGVDFSSAMQWLPGGSTPSEAPDAAAAALGRFIVVVLLAGVTALIVVKAIRKLNTGQQSIAAILAIAVTAVVAFDMVTLWRGTVPVNKIAASTISHTPATQALSTAQGSNRIAAASGDSGVLLAPNTGSYLNLRDARGHGVPTLRRYFDFWRATGGQARPNLGHLAPSWPNAVKAMQASSVSALLVDPAATFDNELRSAKTLHADKWSRVIKVPGATPRVSVACNWSNNRYADALNYVSQADARKLASAPALEGVEAPSGTLCTPTETSAQITSDQANKVVIATTSNGPGKLVLNDAIYPGWKATVNGQPAKITPANVLFRAVEIGPGKSTVVFTYRPRSFIYGSLLSLISLLTILGWFISTTRRKPALR